MDELENIIEYYDELYPITNEHKKFMESTLNSYQMPAKILRIGCATGTLEHYLARLGYDVTGIDSSTEFIDSANLKRRFPNTAIRFFNMTSTEITHFLGKNFYNIIASLEGSFYSIHDETLRKKFFYDCRTLLADGGCLIIHTPDITTTRESIRISLHSQIESTMQETGKKTYTLTQKLYRGDRHYIPVRTATPIAQPNYSEIEEFAKEAGFTKIECFLGYSLTPCTNVHDANLFIIK